MDNPIEKIVEEFKNFAAKIENQTGCYEGCGGLLEEKVKAFLTSTLTEYGKAERAAGLDLRREYNDPELLKKTAEKEYERGRTEMKNEAIELLDWELDNYGYDLGSKTSRRALIRNFTHKLSLPPTNP